jgi:hypothetical protein
MRLMLNKLATEKAPMFNVSTKTSLHCKRVTLKQQSGNKQQRGANLLNKRSLSGV